MSTESINCKIGRALWDPVLSSREISFHLSSPEGYTIELVTEVIRYMMVVRDIAVTKNCPYFRQASEWSVVFDIAYRR